MNDATEAKSPAGDGLGASPVRQYVPVLDRGYPDTAQTEMARLLDECAKLGRENARLQSLMIRIYNSGYKAGHHDTVEAGYVDIHDCDMETYHAETVEDILSNV